MAKRRLSKKLKEQIKQNPQRIRKADLTPEAQKYLNRIRGARKAVKTKLAKKTYKAPRKKSEEAPAQVSDLIDVAARMKGISTKKFRKLYPKEVADFERDMTIRYSRDAQLLKKDIQFLPKGKFVYNNGKRVRRDKAQYLITRLYNKIQEAPVSERVGLFHHYDGAGNLHINVPSPQDYIEMDGDEFLEFLDDNYPEDITYYMSTNKKKK